MKKNIIPLLMLCISLNAQNPSAKEIIEKVDKNMSAESRIFTGGRLTFSPSRFIHWFMLHSLLSLAST